VPREACAARPLLSMKTPALRVGMDMVSVSDVAGSLERFGDRYVRRLYTKDEADYCRAAAGRASAERFAARFAAKEAAVKVLRPSDPWGDWRAIEVRRDPGGWTDVVLRGLAATLAARAGIIALHLSLSHTGEYATAVVVAELA